MEQKQTAVEWLIKKLQNREKGIFDGLPYLSLDEIYNQAKEMEKQQIVNAHLIGIIRPLEIEATKQAEQYYNEEYGK